MTETAEKKGLGKRQKVLLGLIVVLAGLMLVYCWMAFGPTGYGTIESRQAEAIKMVDEQIRPAVRTESNPKERERKTILTAPDSSLYRVNKPTKHMILTRLDISTRYQVTGDNLVEVVRAKLPQMGPEIIMRPNIGTTTGYDARTTAQRTVLMDNVEDVLLHAQCDLGMIPKPGSAHPDQPANYPRFARIPAADAVCQAAADAVRRACKQNQPEKAAVLIERLAELTRQLHLARFPDDYYAMAPLQELLLDLGNTKEFPAEGFDRIRPIIEKMHLDDEQYEAVKLAYLADQCGQQLQNLRAMRITMSNYEQVAAAPLGSPAIPKSIIEEIHPYMTATPDREKHFKNNTYHYFIGGMVEGFGFKVLQPLMVKTYEEGMVALYNNDMAKIVDCQKRLIMYCRWINMTTDDVPKLMDNECFLFGHMRDNIDWEMRDAEYFQIALSALANKWAKATQGKRFNTSADFTRLILAYERFKRANGRAPKNVAELSPKYLDAAFNKGGGAQFEIATIEPFPSIKWPPPSAQGAEERKRNLFSQVLSRLTAHQQPDYFVTYDALLAEAKTNEEKKAVEGQKGGMRSVDVLVRIGTSTLTWNQWKYGNGLIWREKDLANLKPELVKKLKQIESDARTKLFGGKDEAECVEIEAVVVNK